MPNKGWLYWAAGLSVGALLAHGIDAPDHLREWWVYGTIFIIAGSFQLFYGLALLVLPWRYDETGGIRADAGRFGRPWFMRGIALSAFVILVYIVTRTTGLPFLSRDAVAEPVTVLSLVPIVTNAALIGALSKLLTDAKQSGV